MQTTENTHPQSFKAHLSSNSSHKEQAEPLALLQNWVQGKGEGSCKKKQKKLEVAFKRWKEVAGFFPPIKLTEPPQAEPSALQEAEKLERYFFLWLIQETPFSHQVHAKNLTKITPWVSKFWKVTIIQENAWAKFSITAIYSQLCSSTKRQIKHAQYSADMCFKTALQDVIAVVAFLVHSSYTVHIYHFLPYE